MRYFLFIVIALIFNSHIYGQSLFEAHNILSDQLIKLNSESTCSTSDIKQTLDMITNAFSNENISVKDTDRLLSGYNNYLQLTTENVEIDSLQKIFYDFYIDFSQAFIGKFSKRVFESPGNKLLFFGTSVSCPCTIKLCVEQIIDVIKISKEKGMLFLIVDSFNDTHLTTEYEIGFYPTILVVGNENIELTRFTRDKNLSTNLADRYNNKNN